MGVWRVLVRAWDLPWLAIDVEGLGNGRASRDILEWVLICDVQIRTYLGVTESSPLPPAEARCGTCEILSEFIQLNHQS